MRTEISTNEMADRFGKAHRSILRDIRGLDSYGDKCISGMFVDSFYTSLQNKKLPCKLMGVNGFCLLTDTWGYSRGKAAAIKAEILSEFGERFVVIGSARTRLEDSFYSMLKEFLHKHTILRQFPIGKHKVDFYLPDHGVIIEYDEDQHFSKTALDADLEREKAVTDHYLEEYDDKVIIVRVKKGEEVRGMSEIAGILALHTLNAGAITKYAARR